MFIEAAFITTMNAQEVANGLHYLLKEAPPGKLLRLDISETNAQTTERTHWISPLSEDPVVTTDKGCETVRCTTEEGERIDIIIGPPHLRAFRPAAVVFPSRDKPEHP